jgi:hypothetical protein
VTVKIVFGSPVPVRVGVVSETRDQFVGVVIDGADGAVESRVKLATVGELTFPRVSVLVIEIGYTPSTRAGEIVML